ncbi:DUF4906 domain-containing protein [Parabacteroides sp.]
MTLLSLVLIGSGCEEQIDPAKVPSNEGKQVEVSLNIGFADEVDGAGYGTSPATKADAGSNRSAFEVLPVTDMRTKAGDGKPDKIYKLEIIQYKSNNTVASQTIISEQQIGQTFTISLDAEDHCKLLFIAWGSSSGFNTPTDKSLKAIQELKVKAKDSNINQIATDATGSALANMPYFLYLEDVNIVEVNGTNKIQSPEGKDVRLMLQRLAVKVQLDWSLSQKMKDAGYSLREVKLCQAPADYRLIPQAETTPQWGDVYPSSVAEFVDLYRLTGDELTASNTKTVWMPANSRGISPKATAPIYRNKENANPAATYAEFVVDHTTEGKNDQRLYYRAYLGGNTTDDFNLLENTNYHWKININTAEYTNDQRIQPLDLTPVFSENLQTTANCFMMKPGTNICFNPYRHEAGTSGWNTYLTASGQIKDDSKKITNVKVLWQSKDAGTGGDLVMGYVIDNNDHTNLVNFVDDSNIENVRIHVKVPVTNGGNAVIAAYNANGTIVWSWHLWISYYVPMGISQTITDENTRKTAVAAARSACVGGTVHQYRGTAWTYNNGYFYNKVIMDRNLGALNNTWSTSNSLESARAYGNLYQWGRKDPMPGSADGSKDDIDLMFDENGIPVSLQLQSTTQFQQENYIQNPTIFYTVPYNNLGNASYLPSSTAWGTNKTIYDPCPAGWIVPDFQNTTQKNIWSDFSNWTDNLRMLVNGDWRSSGDNTNVTASDFHIMNGMRYKIADDDYAWFPFVRVREVITGLLRDPYRHNHTGAKTEYNSKLLPCFAVFGANQGTNNHGWYIEFKYAPKSPEHDVGIKPYGFCIRCIQK